MAKKKITTKVPPKKGTPKGGSKTTKAASKSRTTKKKSWREKLENSKDLPRTAVATEEMNMSWGVGTFVIPAPLEVDAIMKQVRKGKLITIREIRAALATRHETEFTCPITTGIFAWISANAAAEALAEGKKRVTPYWRTLKTGGELNPKYPGGVEDQKARLEAEGHNVIKKGKRTFVEDFEASVVPAGKIK